MLIYSLEILANISQPKLASLPIKRQLPGIAEANSPDLWPDTCTINKGIVRRHCIALTVLNLIDIESQDFAQQTGQILGAGHVRTTRTARIRACRFLTT